MRTDKNFVGVKPKISILMRKLGTTGSDARITVTDSDLVYNSMTFRYGTSDSGEITVGAAITSSCSFAIWNDKHKFDNWDWKNTACDVTLTFGTDKLIMGSFLTISHKSTGNTIKVETLDWLKLLDEHQISECNITWPIDAVDLINTIVTTGIVNLGFTGLDDARGVLLPDPGDDTMSNRDALAYAAQCLGKYAIMHKNPDDEGWNIHFDWYNDTDRLNAGVTFSHDLRTDDVNVTGVKVTANDNETTDSRGTTDYVINIADNPFISKDNITTVANRIEASVVGMTFRPGDFVIATNPAIEAGDTLDITTADEENIKVIASTVVYKPSATKQSITADAEDADGDLQIKTSQYVRKVIKDELNNPASALGSAVGSAGGLNGQWEDSGTFVLNDQYAKYRLGTSTVNGIAFDVNEEKTRCKHCMRSGHVTLVATADSTHSIESVTVIMSDMMLVDYHSDSSIRGYGALALYSQKSGNAQTIDVKIYPLWGSGKLRFTIVWSVDDGVKSGDTLDVQIVTMY